MLNTQFGRLTVIAGCERRSSKGEKYWVCRCICGIEKEIKGTNLKSGTTASCGCLARELSSQRGRAFAKPPVFCSVENCEEHVGRRGAKGMCGKHYMRVKRYGDADYLTPDEVRRANNREAQMNRRPAKPTTYKKLFGRHEHRVIGEQLAGRLLRSDEHVHHKDDNKHNNAPSNLEVLPASEHIKLHHGDLMQRRKAKHGY